MFFHFSVHLKMAPLIDHDQSTAPVPPSSDKKSRKRGGPARSKSLSAAHSTSGSITRNLISSPTPNSFKHVAHIGVNKEGLFETTKDLGDHWNAMLTDLQGHGVSEAVVLQHSDFVEGFWKGFEAAQKAESTDSKKVFGGMFVILPFCIV